MIQRTWDDWKAMRWKDRIDGALTVGGMVCLTYLVAIGLGRLPLPAQPQPAPLLRMPEPVRRALETDPTLACYPRDGAWWCVTLAPLGKDTPGYQYDPRARLQERKDFIFFNGRYD